MTTSANGSSDGLPSTVDDEIDSVAIVGMSGCFPGASSVDELWDNIRNGVESIRSFTGAELRASGLDPALLEDPTYINARGVLENVRGFDAKLFGFNPREADVLDPQQRLFLEYAWAALEHAGYPPIGGLSSVGVYAGVGVPAYLFQLFGNPAVRRSVGDYELVLANDKDQLTTRVAYKLNLHGPAITVQTACSTSLTAVVLACQALLTYQCDLALAGGAAVQVAAGGYRYQEGGILSPDGHCRAFDADAAGAVPGSGVGVVVLKRLSEALADGDTIHAVIRGAAINNDGSDKVGFTAPSVAGQAEVIATAQGLAGVSPDEITYVEAHGTGTALGDPIEVAALTRAFRRGTARTGYCGLGSVKSNIGHLDAAAGVAGLVKAVQALRHRELPPTLHVRRPNPKLDLESSPFYLTTELRPWPEGPTPRRAGVSSFGVGGTNAHVVVEEAPPPARGPGSARPTELLLLAAATPTALDQVAVDLAAHLLDHAEWPMADVAFTLQVGRAALPHRRAVVARTPADAAVALRGGDARRAASGVAAERAPSVALLFPGQGAQHVGMARELYAHAPVFRAELDRCCELLEPHLGRDLRAVLFAPSGDADAGAELRRTELAQPALFAVEYALAQWWQTLGVEPRALLGHSIGEYVAACLAGVFALEDALGLVAARGRLMQALPPGSMLAVPLAEAELRSRLGPELTLAAVNGPDLCVASGPTDAVDALEAHLADRGVVGTRLHTSHAFHSAMMDPIRASFAALVAGVPRSAPRIPFVSNVTGTWITPEQATDPAYWAEHLRATVRFGDGLATLLTEPSRLLLEVGPGEALTRLASRHPARRVEQATVATLPHPTDRRSDLDAALLAAGHLWTAGLPLDPTGLWPDGGRRVPLPTYPFEHHDHWIGVQSTPNANLGISAAESLEVSPDIGSAGWLYEPVWRPSPLADGATASPSEPAADSRWLIFLDRAGLGAGLAARLRSAGCFVATVTAGERFARLGDSDYEISPGCREDIDALLADLRSLGALPTSIVHGWSVTPQLPSSDEEACPDLILDRGFYSVVFLAQSLDALPGRCPVRLTVLSNHVQAVTGEELLSPEKATVLGPCLVIPQEHPDLDVRSIDVALPPAGSAREAALLDRLQTELAATSHDGPVAYRGGLRWVQHHERILPPAVTGRCLRLREGGVYLITGGMGGIGLSLAEHLAATVRAKLVLLGRSAMPARVEWDAWLAAHGDDDLTSRRIRRVRAIEEHGGEVLALAADVADLDQMRSAVDQTLTRFGRLDGVIHAAGVTTADAFLAVSNLGPAEVERQWRPKVRGVRVLEAVLDRCEPDFCLLFSSLSATLGGLGFGAYAAANIFLDAVAHQRALAGHGRWISVNWDGWRTSESSAGGEAGGRAGDQGVTAIGLDDGMALFDRVLSLGDRPRMIVATGNLRDRFNRWVGRVPSQNRTSGAVASPGTPDSALDRHARPDIRTAFVAPRDDIEQDVAAIWQDLLGLTQVGVHDSFFDLGGHSLLGLRLTAKLRDTFQTECTLQQLFEAPTVAELATLVGKQRPNGVADPALAEMLRLADQLSEQEISALLTSSELPGEGS